MNYKEASEHEVTLTFSISLKDIALFRNALSDLGNNATKGRLSFTESLLSNLSPEQLWWIERLRYSGSPHEEFPLKNK